MNICIHYQSPKGPWGGSNSFLTSLRRFLERQPDIRVTDSLDQPADVILINSWTSGTRNLSLDQIRHVRSFGKTARWKSWFSGRPARLPKIVHRLDGIGYLYGRTDRTGDDLQTAVNALSDRSIVQSLYSQNLFQKENIRLSPTTVISNGVDADLFHVKGKAPWDKTAPLIIGAASWSANPRKGHAAIARFSKLPGVQVRFTGNWPGDIDPAQVERLPAIPFGQLGDFYRRCHAFLFPGEGESCPNVVLEAISCGLPVLYHDSGGTPEVAAPYGIALNPDAPELSLEQLRLSYSSLWDRLQSDPLRYAMQRTGKMYLELFQSLL